MPMPPRTMSFFKGLKEIGGGAFWGCKKLAEISLDLELKGKENDLEYLKENHDKLMLELENIINIISEYLGDE